MLSCNFQSLFKKALFILFYLTFFANSGNSQDTLSKDELNYNLLMASYYGITDSIIYWINLGADVNTISSDGITPLNYAIQSRSLNAVKALVLNGANVNYFSYRNIPAIFLSVSYNEYEMFKFLLEKGAKTDVVIQKNINLLHYAVKYSSIDIVTKILKNNPKLLTLKDYDGNTPLMAAVYFKRYDLIDLLCQSYKFEEHHDKYGLSPLLLAIMNADTLMAELLLNCGANLKERSFNDYGLVEYAVISKDEKTLLWALRKNQESKKKHFPVKLSYVSENRQLAKVFRKSGYPDYYGLIFTKINIGFSHMFTGNDYMFGFTSRIKDYRYGIQNSLSYHTRLWPNRILLTTNEENVFIQVWETRSLLSFTLNKHISLYKKTNRTLYFLGGLSYYLTYGKYRGFENRPQAFTFISPSFSLSWETKRYSFSVSCEYFKFNNIDAQRLHIFFSQTFTIPFKSIYLPNKKITW